VIPATLHGPFSASGMYSHPAAPGWSSTVAGADSSVGLPRHASTASRAMSTPKIARWSHGTPAPPNRLPISRNTSSSSGVWNASRWNALSVSPIADSTASVNSHDRSTRPGSSSVTEASGTSSYWKLKQLSRYLAALNHWISPSRTTPSKW
jgi:hypothetical protein